MVKSTKHNPMKVVIIIGQPRPVTSSRADE